VQSTDKGWRLQGVKGRVLMGGCRGVPVPWDMWKCKQEIIHLYVDKRLSLKEIGERFGHSHVAVIYLLEAAGVRRITRGWRSHWPWRDWKQRTKEIVGAYVEDELSLEEVGARFSLSPTCVREILIRAGVGCRSPGWPAWRLKALARRDEEISRLCLEEGVKRKEVAARFDLRPETVSRILAKANMHRRQPEAK
jgi:DNA-directed RNA polymerase specialized sigma subunit